MDPPASREISLGSEVCLPDYSDSTVSTFSSVCTLHLPLSRRLSTVPNFTSSLLLFFVQTLFKNFVINCREIFDQNFVFFTERHQTWRICCIQRQNSGYFQCPVWKTKVDKKQTYMKTETCKLYSRVFWIFLLNIVKINPYNFWAILFQSWVIFWNTVYTVCNP